VKVEPLEYARPRIQLRKRAVLPFIVLGAGVLEVIGGALVIMLLSLCAGDDRGKTAADWAQMRLFENLFWFTIYFGASIGLSGAISIAIRRRRYGPISLVCAIFGIALCFLPLLLWAVHRPELLDPVFWSWR
jgi:hypothetical protein